ncbi:MAG: hypothetical protein JW994_06840 [Candidatus Omnitrophica bacterium]|nr:hypothetical protein [Candidatus Omnitrophota bacterium]
MKKICIIVALSTLIACLSAAAYVFAESKTVLASGGVDVEDVFSLEFYTDDPNILYTTAVPFTQMDPTKTFVQSDGREADSGKSDIGLLCKTNLAVAWYLKIKGSTGSLISVGEIKYGLWQPWNRTLNQSADGVISEGAGWHAMPTASTTVYTSGINDNNNLPYGTLFTFDFAINPSRLDPTAAHFCTIQYTFTTTP